MLRLGFSSLALFALSLPLYGQTTYNIFTNVGTSFTDISGSGTVQLNPSDDNITGPVALPFTFNLYGVNYSNVVLSTNGNLQFGGTASSAFNNLDLITNNSPNTAGFVAGFWDDLDATGATFTAPAGRVLTQTLGSPGSQIFVAQWHQWGHNDDSNGDPARTVTFQIKLFEGSNNIAFVYNDTVFPFSPADNGISATIGITSGPFNDPLNPTAQFSFNTASLGGINDILFSSVPEPSTMIMSGAGVAMSLAAAYRWKRRLRRSRKQQAKQA